MKLSSFKNNIISYEACGHRTNGTKSRICNLKMAGVEAAPLLGHSSSGNYSSVYPSAPPGNGSPPPSYEAANCFPPREKACDVCSYNIDISKKTNDYVVTCPRCSELTALGNPPRGKRYVRCTCNKLLQCVKTATTVACDRPGCGAELKVQEQAVARVQIQQPGRRSGEMTEPHGGRCYRFICCHCNSVSVLDTVPSSHFRCRHCGKRSSTLSMKKKATFMFTLALLVLILVLAFMGSTIFLKHNSGYQFVYLGGIVVALYCVGHGLWFLCMKQSTVEVT